MFWEGHFEARRLSQLHDAEAAVHQSREWSDRERYAQSCQSLLGVGDGEQSDRSHEIEFRDIESHRYRPAVDGRVEHQAQPGSSRVIDIPSQSDSCCITSEVCDRPEVGSIFRHRRNLDVLVLHRISTAPGLARHRGSLGRGDQFVSGGSRGGDPATGATDAFV